VSGRGTHHAGGAVAGLTVAGAALAAGASPWPALAVAVTATATGGGRLSPDVDQYRAWRRLDRWLPDELLGAGGPLQHRGISHWWGTALALPVVLAGLLALVVPVGWVWPVPAGVAAGWASHLALDYVFGATVRTPEGCVIVRAGVPAAPWWSHRGVHWPSGGTRSKVAGCLLTVTAVVQVVLIVHWAGVPALSGGLP